MILDLTPGVTAGDREAKAKQMGQESLQRRLALRQSHRRRRPFPFRKFRLPSPDQLLVYKIVSATAGSGWHRARTAGVLGPEAGRRAICMM